MKKRIVEELYDMEALIPLVTRLSEKYTSKESSSISYETARMLMESILYTIEESLSKNSGFTVSKDHPPLPEVLYEEGYDIIQKKAKQAARLYDGLISDFEDYGCLNYRDTIQHGMPEFFLYYDARFCPTDHLLTLDYPCLVPTIDLFGVDKILTYLECISLEKQFLNAFLPSAVKNLLKKLHREYETLYLDNICEPVLYTAMLCGVAGCSIQNLNLTPEDSSRAYLYFRQDTVDSAQEKIKALILQMTASIPNNNGYFASVSRDFAVRILQM